MAKKEIRRAARQVQRTKDAGPKKPTIRRAVIQGAILSALYLVIVQLFMKDQSQSIWGLPAPMVYTPFFWAFYSVFIYYWETFLFNRRQRKQSGGKK